VTGISTRKPVLRGAERFTYARFAIQAVKTRTHVAGPSVRTLDLTSEVRHLYARLQRSDQTWSSPAAGVPAFKPVSIYQQECRRVPRRRCGPSGAPKAQCRWRSEQHAMSNYWGRKGQGSGRGL